MKIQRENPTADSDSSVSITSSNVSLEHRKDEN